MQTEFLCLSVLRVTSGPRVKLAGRKSALNPLEVYSTDRSKAVVPVLVLLFVVLWFILRGYLFYVLLCVILFLCFFSPFSIAITSLGEERASVGAFRAFVRWFCLIPFPLGVWDGQRFVIVAPPGLFSYPFFYVFSKRFASAYDTVFLPCSCLFYPIQLCELIWGRGSFLAYQIRKPWT